MFIFENVEQIISTIKNPKNKEFIEFGRKIKVKHELHVCGKHKDKFLEKFLGVENQKALELRKQTSYYFTVPIISNATKPIDKVFSAKGTAKYYNISNQKAEIEFRKILNNLNVKNFLFQNWKNVSLYDPNGLIFMEISKDGLKCYPTYKSIDSIYDIDFESNTEINYIIFEPETVKEKVQYSTIEYKKYRIVDSKYDYIIIENNNKFTLSVEETLLNNFEKVPAVFVSNRIHKHRPENFDTYISEGIILADAYFKDASVHEVYKLKQGFPYVFEVKAICPVCEGSKVDEKGEDCRYCNGTGVTNKFRDIADKFIIDPSMSDKELRPIAGYIQPDLETWNVQNAEMDKIEMRINSAIWGDESRQIEKSKSANTTAFEISVTKESKSDKLSLISENLEIIETFITNILGKFYLNNMYIDCSINYSKHYNLTTVEEAFANYINAKKEGCSSTILNSFWEAYLSILYDKNEIELKRNLMKLYTKPFFHYTGKELIEMQIDKIDYLSNLYYDEFAIDYEKNVKPFYLATIEEVDSALEIYIKNKELNEYTNLNTNQTTN